MSSNKFIYNRNHSGDEEDIDIQSPCFFVRSDISYKEVPTNGEEYLLKVIRERKKISAVTKCDKDYSKFAKNQSWFVKNSPNPSVPEILKPTIEWQNIQVADFSDIRMYISRLLANTSMWSNKLKQTTIDDKSIIGWKVFFATKEPTLSCVLGLHQELLCNGLEMLTKIIDTTKEGSTIEYKTGQWIYAFLACTRQPLLSDTISILRNLARKCAEIRSRINPEDENAIAAVAPLNIFISLVARYFRQYDLADS